MNSLPARNQREELGLFIQPLHQPESDFLMIDGLTAINLFGAAANRIQQVDVVPSVVRVPFVTFQLCLSPLLRVSA